MALKREGLFRRIYQHRNGYYLYKCTNCGNGPMHINVDPSSEPCENCGLATWRELNEAEFLFETDLLDYFASYEDKLIALEEISDVGLQGTSMQQEVQELKLYFADFADSMKATQMEMIHAMNRNDRRHPSDYEPCLVDKLGELYSCLQTETKRALQRAELLFNITREPDGFGSSVLAMALGYENELVVRVIWPFVDDLLRLGTRMYDALGRAKDKLIFNGRVGRLTLGTLGWYLENDLTMRGSVAKRGFNVQAISREIDKVNRFRNKSAHELSFDRTAADDLRRIMLSPDGALRSLHPNLRSTESTS
jgi:hypothetical protein